MQRDLLAVKPLREPLRALNGDMFLSSWNHLEKEEGVRIPPSSQSHPKLKDFMAKKANLEKATSNQIGILDSTVPVIWFNGSPEKALKGTYFYEMLRVLV